MAALDLNQFYTSVLPAQELARIERLEPFDEYEELHLKCSHYFILAAANGDCTHLIGTLQKTDSGKFKVEIYSPKTSIWMQV